MPVLSEFIGLIAERSGVKKANLVEQDILLHRILREVYSFPRFKENYLFKGGSRIFVRVCDLQPL